MEHDITLVQEYFLHSTCMLAQDVPRCLKTGGVPQGVAARGGNWKHIVQRCMPLGLMSEWGKIETFDTPPRRPAPESSVHHNGSNRLTLAPSNAKKVTSRLIGVAF